MRFEMQRRGSRKMLLHGVGAQLTEINRPGIRKEKIFIVA
jgi:hypothetical protein